MGKADYQSVKRTEIEERRQKVAALYLARCSQHEIAERLGVGQATISRDLEALREEWKQEQQDSVNAVLTRELAELQEIESSAAEQYAITREPQWLAARLKVKEMRAKLLGLNAAQRVDVNHSGEGASTGVVIYLPSNGRDALMEGAAAGADATSGGMRALSAGEQEGGEDEE